jgi:hypothetical protein
MADEVERIETMEMFRDGGQGYAANNLSLYIDNESVLYPKRMAVVAGLKKKWKAGKYDHKRALDAWKFLVDDAAKRYAKEFAFAKDWLTLFPAVVRHAVVQEKADRWQANAKAGRLNEG